MDLSSRIPTVIDGAVKMFRNKKRYVVDTYGAEVLRETAAPIPEITDGIRSLAQQMWETMRCFDGIGLAAPQVGKALRLVVLGVPPESISEEPSSGELALLPRMPLVLVNPEIISYSEDENVRDEGCLSVPEIYAPVRRPSRVVLRSQLLDGTVITEECGGLLGRCIQHELDHLDGKLFVDRVDKEDLAEVAADLRRLERYGAKHHFRRVATVR